MVKSRINTYIIIAIVKKNALAVVQQNDEKNNIEIERKKKY